MKDCRSKTNKSRKNHLSDISRSSSSSSTGQHKLVDDHKRIGQLENELSRLRSQLAQIILAQEAKSFVSSSGEQDLQVKRFDADGESDTNQVEISGVGKPTMFKQTSYESSTPISPPIISSSIPPPPPLSSIPPPPLGLLNVNKIDQPNWRDQLKQKVAQKKVKFVYS